MAQDIISALSQFSYLFAIRTQLELCLEIMTYTFKAIFAASILALSFVASLAADSLEDAVAAYRRADYATALRLYGSLAHQGLDVAQFNLGLMYDNGQGVSKDEAEATKWYRLAADQGRADAQYQLGHLYYKQTNYAEAVRWFRLAADQGRADAQSNLGAMYAEGDGIPQDLAQALKWFILAAAQNHREAIENRDKVILLMTPVQIAEAQKLAREWKPPPPTAR
jgi:TPR repeat protein